MLALALAGQEVPAPSVDGLVQYGVLGIVAALLFWFAWQTVKNLRADLLETRAELKASRDRELAMAEKMGSETATLLAQATSALSASRRRGTG